MIDAKQNSPFRFYKRGFLHDYSWFQSKFEELAHRYDGKLSDSDKATILRRIADQLDPPFKT